MDHHGAPAAPAVPKTPPRRETEYDYFYQKLRGGPPIIAPSSVSGGYQCAHEGGKRYTSDKEVV